MKPVMNCKQNDVITTTITTTTTSTTTVPTTPHTGLCMNCLNIGGQPLEGSEENISIEQMITNINPNPVPVIIRCEGLFS